MPNRSRLGLWKLLHASEQQSMAQGAFKDEVEPLFGELSIEVCSESGFSGSAMIVSTSTSFCFACSHVGSGLGSGLASTFMPELQ